MPEVSLSWSWLPLPFPPRLATAYAFFGLKMLSILITPHTRSQSSEASPCQCSQEGYWLLCASVCKRAIGQPAPEA